MKVDVLLFAIAKDKIGKGSVSIAIKDPTTLREVLAAEELSALAGMLGVMRFAINEDFAEVDARVHNGDVIAVLPPVSGG